MLKYAFIIPILPALAFGIIIFFTRWYEKLSSAISITAILIGLGWSIGILVKLIGDPTPYEAGFTWIALGGVELQIGILIDSLTAIMLVVVCTVSALVQIYSLGYMHGDPRFSRYYSFLSLFTTSMLGLVIANNFAMIFIFWELVGLTSYLLIGFFFEKKSAADAGKKAFITTRIGDLGFIVGILMLVIFAGTLNYGEVFHMAEHGEIPAGILAAIGIFLFCGAIGKSAQFPLHVWLPDAMEGPTPVSALIHAATMVAAGVYLVARSASIFAASETAGFVVAVIGAITALMAASIGLVQNDIKRVLAYSTVSQLGYMIMAIGLGSMTAGVFHLMTHAFFKALLFLGAGSVIHAAHTQDIREMGGLSNKMKITSVTFIIGSLSLAGIFPLSGFWSKDEIVASTRASDIHVRRARGGVYDRVLHDTPLYHDVLRQAESPGALRSCARVTEVDDIPAHDPGVPGDICRMGRDSVVAEGIRIVRVSPSRTPRTCGLYSDGCVDACGGVGNRARLPDLR